MMITSYVLATQTLRGVYSVNYINDTEYNIIKPPISKECYYFKLNC